MSSVHNPIFEKLCEFSKEELIATIMHLHDENDLWDVVLDKPQNTELPPMEMDHVEENAGLTARVLMDTERMEESTLVMETAQEERSGQSAYGLWMCCEKQAFIFSLPLRDLVSLFQVCRRLRSRREEVLGRLVTRLLRRYISNPLGLRKVMRDAGAILSGSSVLWLIEGMPSTWTPNDLDIYAPIWKAQRIIRFLIEREGYTEVPREKPFPEDYMKLGFLSSVTKLRKGEQSIDVMESLSPNVLQPITFFYTTLVMNYITSDSIKILYPLLTFSRFGVPQYAAPHRREVQWRKKYSERTFQVCPSFHIPLRFQSSIFQLTGLGL